MHTTDQTTSDPASQSGAAPVAADVRQRARELWDQDLLGIDTLVARGHRDDAIAALVTLLNRSDPDQARELLEHATLQELAREAQWQGHIGHSQRRDVRWVPPSRVRVRRVARLRPAAPRRLAGDAAAAAYFAEHHASDHDVATVEEPQRDRPVWDGPDHDRAAVPGLRGAACIGCKLERTRADRANPDGLCIHCREGGLTRELVIQRSCALIADANPGPRAIELLRAAWKRAARDDDRNVISAWVAAHTDLRPTPHDHDHTTTTTQPR